MNVQRALRTALPILMLLAVASLAVVGAEEGGGPKKGTSLLDLYFHTMPIGGVLTILSFITFSLSITWIFTIKRETFVPPGLADDLHNLFQEGVTDEAFEQARGIVESDPSMLGKVLAAGLSKKDFGYEAMKEAIELTGVAEHNLHMAKVSWLSMFSSSATLLGLLGTVSGIISAFLTMSSNPAGVDPNQLAGSIGEALVCTAMGLCIAIIGLYFFFALRNRVNQCALDAGVIAHEVLDYFRPQH